MDRRATRATVRIATFNVNNINKRLDNILAWLAETTPDIVCLQELKADQDRFPHGALRDAGYVAAWQGQRSWNGVAILAKGERAPIVTRTRLPGDPDDRQARYIEAAVAGILVTSIYLPNGNPRPGPKFDYKLAWFERLIAHADSLLAEGIPVVLAGDFNVVPCDLDIYTSTSWGENALLRPEAVPHSPGCSIRVGSMPSGRCIRENASTRSGTTSATAGSETPACASIICYSVQRLPRSL